MALILVTPTITPGQVFYLAYEEIIPEQLLSNPDEGVEAEYSRVVDEKFEFEIIKKYAEIVTRSKIPVVEQTDDYLITTVTDTWYVAKISVM
ncbi:MAG: hypothetical protein WC756_09610 [Taibaiella sp.]